MTVKEGRYNARATEAALGATNKGTEYVGVYFDILDEEGKRTGESIRWDAYFSGKAEQFTLEGLAHCGWGGDDFDKFTGVTDRVVSIVVEHEVSSENGKAYARVRWVNPKSNRGEVVRNALDDSARASFADRMKGRAAAVVDKVKAGQAPEPKGTDAPGDSEIPF